MSLRNRSFGFLLAGVLALLESLFLPGQRSEIPFNCSLVDRRAPRKIRLKDPEASKGRTPSSLMLSVEEVSNQRGSESFEQICDTLVRESDKSLVGFSISGCLLAS